MRSLFNVLFSFPPKGVRFIPTSELSLTCYLLLVTCYFSSEGDGKLDQQVKEWFEKAKNNNFSGIEYSYHDQVESGHHRLEKRQVYSAPITALPPLHNQNKWQGLKTVIMVVSERQLWNKTTNEVQFYRSSLISNAQLLSHGIRSHWGIENTLHWSLDVTFSEDKIRISRTLKKTRFKKG